MKPKYSENKMDCKNNNWKIHRVHLDFLFKNELYEFKRFQIISVPIQNSLDKCLSVLMVKKN